MVGTYVHQRVDTEMKKKRHPWVKGKAKDIALMLGVLKIGDEVKIKALDAQDVRVPIRDRRCVCRVENPASVYVSLQADPQLEGWWLVRTPRNTGYWVTIKHIKAWRPKQHS